MDRLLRWPPARLFPALDVTRLVALDPKGAAHLAAGAGACPHMLPAQQCHPSEALAACRMCQKGCSAVTSQTHFGECSLHSAGDGGLGAALHSATIGIALSSNQQTGLKLLCNTLRHTSLQQWLQANLPALQDGFARCCSSEQKNVRLSYATFMLNLSTLFHGTLRDDIEGQAQVGSAAFMCMCFDNTG